MNFFKQISNPISTRGLFAMLSLLTNFAVAQQPEPAPTADERTQNQVILGIVIALCVLSCCLYALRGRLCNGGAANMVDDEEGRGMQQFAAMRDADARAGLAV